jgi:hypothetical protein
VGRLRVALAFAALLVGACAGEEDVVVDEPEVPEPPGVSEPGARELTASGPSGDEEIGELPADKVVPSGVEPDPSQPPDPWHGPL